jgi:hypothetical protein
VLLETVIAAESGSPARVDLVDAFRESRSPVLGAAMTRFLTSPNAALVSIGLRGSLLGGDSSVIVAARRNYAALSAAPGWAAFLQDVKTGYVNTDPRAVETLGQVAIDAGAGADLRVAAAGALARMHTLGSLPYLAQLLTDSNASLRTMAVGGLAMFANNVPIDGHEPAPGPWKYRTDETIAHSAFDETVIGQREPYFLGFWETWWRQNQRELESTPARAR